MIGSQPANQGPDPEQLHPRVLAHLGDAVYEVYIRRIALEHGHTHLKALHRFTTQRVSGQFQSQLIAWLQPTLTEDEQDLVRRGRNLPVSSHRRSDHQVHRHASGFEALIGYLYLNDPARLEVIWQQIAPWIEQPEKLPPSDAS